MKKVIKKLVKLLDWLITTLTKVVQKGVTTIEQVKKVNAKSEKLSLILLDITKLIEKLQEKRNELEKVSEEEN